MSVKRRLDQVVFEKGWAQSRQRAQALIIAGNVLLRDTPVTKPGHSIGEVDEAFLRLRSEDHPYVSRGAIKLKAAIEAFQVSTENKVALDVGASTGGFTEILLLGGVSQVFALDVGYNQLAWKIRTDPRVVVHEKINARHLDPSLIGKKVDIIVMDVSFISSTLILPALIPVSKTETDWITLIKPQFEVGRENIAAGGIVTSAGARQQAVDQVTLSAERLGLKRLNLIESPITGADGNLEYLAHWKRL